MKIYCDGGARGNPGPAASAFVVYDDAGNLRHKCGKYLGRATNNVAEYTAVVEAFKWLREQENIQEVIFFLDSNLVVSQLNGVFKIKDENLRNYWVQIKTMEQGSKIKVNFNYIPRTKNAEADKLVNETLDRES